MRRLLADSGLRRLFDEHSAMDGQVKPERPVFTHFGHRAINDVTMLKAVSG